MYTLCIIDLSNGVGVRVGIGIGLELRNISEGYFKTTKVNKYKNRTAQNRAMFNKIKYAKKGRCIC